MEARSVFFIKFNSSMQQTPLSANTRAPASTMHSPFSRKCEIVSPAELVPIPFVKTDLCDKEAAYFKS